MVAAINDVLYRSWRSVIGAFLLVTLDISGEDSREERTKGGCADVEGFHDAEACPLFLRRRDLPFLQVLLVAKEIHQWAAGLSHTAPIPFGEPDDAGRGVRSLEQPSSDVHSHQMLTEKTRRPNARSLAQHEGDTQGINGAHGIKGRAGIGKHLMYRRAP